MNQNGEQWPSRSKNLGGKVSIPPLNPRNVHFMQRLSKQTGIAAADHGGEKRLHLPETIGQLRRKSSVIVKEPPIAFLASLDSLTPELFAKIFTHERMRIELSRIIRVFFRKEFRSS